MTQQQKTDQAAPESNSSLFQGVSAAYIILLLHVLLLAGLGLLVLLFRGFVQYTLWIFLAGSGAIAYSGYRIYRRMKQEKQQLGDILSLPMFRGRSVEIGLLNGMASVKFGSEQNPSRSALPDQNVSRALPYDMPGEKGHAGADLTLQHVQELTELARLYENDMISYEEYEKAKSRLMESVEER